MDTPDRILSAARRLTLERGVVPSLNDVTQEAGVSKGGLMHHFPTRMALVDGLASQALAEITEALTSAASTGEVAVTWLRLSVPAGEEVELFRAMAIAHRTLGEAGSLTVNATTAEIALWEKLLTTEVGDPVTAHIIRLVGDGLVLNALAGTGAPSDAELSAVLEHLIRGGARE